jgi:glycosyltransferase involved in cell wall biosynthesis
MKILFTHRTQGRGAEGAHVLGMYEAFQDLGHSTSMVCLPGCNPADPPPPPTGDARRGPLRRLYAFVSEHAPQVAFELIEIAYNVPLFFRMLARCRRESPDLVYERYSLNNFAPVLVAGLRGVPHVLEVNDSVAIDRSRPLALKRLARVVEGYCLRRTSLVVTISARFEAQVRERFTLPPGKVIVCPNAISERRFLRRPPLSPSRRAALRERYGLRGRFTVGSVGQFVPWHGLKPFVEAMAPLAKELDVSFLFIGDGPVRAEVLESAGRLGVEDRVRFTGMIPLGEVADHLELLDVGVIPFSNVHGSPMKLMEFMAMGLPAVAPDLPPIREVVEDGVTARVFPFGNMEAMASCLRQLLEDPSLRREIGGRAKERVSRELTWRGHAESVLRHLRSQGPGGRAA